MCLLETMELQKRREKMDVLTIIIWAVCSLSVWVIYHKLFDVMYLDLFHGCFKEIVVSGVIGAVLTALVIRFWYVSIVVGVLVVISIFKKR